MQDKNDFFFLLKETIFIYLLKLVEYIISNKNSTLLKSKRMN